MSNPTDNPQEFKYFAFVIDGEVVWNHANPLGSDFERVNAVFSSNPQVVPIPEELGNTVNWMEGWSFIDGQFVLNQE